MIESRERANFELRRECACEAAEASQAEGGEHSAFSEYRPILDWLSSKLNV